MNFFAFITYVVVTTFTPGPNNMMAMSNGLHDGYRKTLRFLAGVFVGFVIVISLCAYLNFALVSFLPKARFWLNLLGTAYMIYLGIHIALTKSAEQGEIELPLNTFKAGMLMQSLNLKLILYGITVFSNFIIPFHRDLPTLTLYSFILAIVGFIATSSWATFGVVFRTIFSRYSKVINISLGLLLIYSALEGFIAAGH
ncbi:MAG: LysE family transporter [Anaerolineales bacterium]